MTESSVTMHKGAAVVVAVVLLASGAAVSYLLMRPRVGDGERLSPVTTSTAPAIPPAVAAPAAGAPAAERLPDVIVSLGADAIERAGIVVASVSSGGSAAEIRLPGIVEPNAYRQVTVTPLVAGRVTQVSAELGARVRRGQTLARIYSPELAEVQTKYVSAKAMLDAHDLELKRTQKLVEIGAASRQELERIHAEHAAQTAAVQSARSQLELLGMPAATIEMLASGSSVDATALVPAPIDGVVTERAVNIGVNVDPATRLFTVVDLSTVWIVADVYEKDFSRVRVGSETTITTPAFPRMSLRGRISYSDPQINPETRTAKMRVEVPNPLGELRIGMYADVVVIGASGGAVPVIPRSAVQNVGNRTVVYLVSPNESGKFIEREIRLGESTGQQVEVQSGVQPGDTVVTDGSFFIRAERERLGIGSGPVGPTAAAGATQRGAAAVADVQTVKIIVNEQGFEPAKVTVRAGTPARLTFVRTTDKTCATEVVFPSLNIKRALPLNQPVDIDFTPAKTDEIAFACGMNMFKGVIVLK